MPLRNLVLAHHMQDLKETTHKGHYERFRFDKLKQMVNSGEHKVTRVTLRPAQTGRKFVIIV